eukprot:Phypoly_transcript_26440.p1 GENE.Phypoly_transcript_26440~~Phypoly_transcript_26440.p1  ORF type:complete len:108 (+),score=8.58 Phypoly_transcript_26440:109-432(+)
MLLACAWVAQISSTKFFKMKWMISALLVFLILAVGSDATVYYWCTADKCNNGKKGVGPTYDCGYGVFSYYDSKNKRWVSNAHSVGPAWSDFSDCCHASNKGACYDAQ